MTDFSTAYDQFKTRSRKAKQMGRVVRDPIRGTAYRIEEVPFIDHVHWYSANLPPKGPPSFMGKPFGPVKMPLSKLDLFGSM